MTEKIKKVVAWIILSPFVLIVVACVVIISPFMLLKWAADEVM